MATGKRPDGEVFASGANEGEVLDFPAISRGWGVTTDGKDGSGNKVTDPTNGIPPMEWFNALQKRTDEAIQWLLQHALPDWAAGTWPAGAVVVNSGVVWRAQKETATEPAADAGDWLALFPVANLDKRYLHADKNLSDLTDAAKAREALALDKVGNWMAVQQGGGTGMKDNKVYAGWDGTVALLQIDATPMGALFYEKNPPTAAQTGAYPKTGGEVDGEVWSEVGNNYRLVAGNRGVFWRFDANSMYLMFTNDGDPHGGYNALRPLMADFATGKLSTGHDFSAGGTLYAGAGACWMATDGNIYGSLWGGYLNNWIAGQISAQVNDVRNWVYQNFVNSSRQASATWAAERVGGGAGLQVPAGCVMIGARNNGSSDVANMGVLYAAEQILINGNWVTIGLA